MPSEFPMSHRWLEGIGVVVAWLGRQGTAAIAGVVIIGIGVPPLGAFLKPFVGAAIFALLTIAFVRVEPATMRRYVTRPGLVAAASAWTTLVVPALFGATAVMAGLNERSPDLFLALMLQGLAPPMMATPAIAALMGLDATLVLLAMTFSTVLTPVAAPAIASAFIGSAFPLSPLLLGLRLSGLLAGSMLAALVLRQAIGPDRIRQWKFQIDGLNVLFFFVFASAAMQGVAGHVMAAPSATIRLALLATAVFIIVMGSTALAFAWAGCDRAAALALMTAQRNLGLMLAATGSVPDLVWLYVGLCQLPIYLSPQLLAPLIRRASSRHGRAGDRGSGERPTAGRHCGLADLDPNRSTHEDFPARTIPPRSSCRR